MTTLYNTQFAKIQKTLSISTIFFKCITEITENINKIQQSMSLFVRRLALFSKIVEMVYFCFIQNSHSPQFPSRSSTQVTQLHFLKQEPSPNQVLSSLDTIHMMFQDFIIFRRILFRSVRALGLKVCKQLEEAFTKEVNNSHQRTLTYEDVSSH